MRKIIYNIIWFLCSIFGVRENNVLVLSYFGGGFTDNPALIAMELKKINPKFNIICLVKDKEKAKKDAPSYVKFRKYNFINRMFYHATCKIWLDNSRKTYFTKKSENQFYVQTWHAGIGLKRVEKDVEDALEKDYVDWAKIDSKNIDLLVSDSDFLTKIYKRAFWYSGEILQIGTPRHDIFFDDEIIEKTYKDIRENLSLEQDTKFVLYAPTFRKDKSLAPYDLDYDEVSRIFAEKFGGNWKVLLRLHPNMREFSSQMNLGKSVIDVSSFPSADNLLLASDAVISDYSSISFDFAVLGRPCFIYANDLENYENDRGFYLDIKNLPFKLSENKEEFAQSILDFNEEEYKKSVEEFYNIHKVERNKNSAKDIANIIQNKVFGNRV